MTRRDFKLDRKNKLLELATQCLARNPNASLNELYVFSPGGVQVQGTFKNVLAHVERWNRFDRLVLVTGLTLSGNSPNLVGQYNLQVFEYTHGDRTKAVAIPQASGGGAGGFGLPVLLQVVGWWLFWPSLLLAISSAWGYLRPARDNLASNA